MGTGISNLLAYTNVFALIIAKWNCNMQVAAVAVLCVQQEPSYRPLITDVLHSLIPLVPMELGGALRVTQPVAH